MTDEIRSKIGLHATDHPNFKGEWFITRNGVTRAFVWIDDATRERLGVKRPYVARSRVVWLQAHPDETLKRHEVIHHRNGNSLDDRPENLDKLPNQRAHAKVHSDVPRGFAARQRQPDIACAQCGAPIRPWRKFCSQTCHNIAQTGSNHPNAGRHWSPEIREHMAAAQRGKKASAETRAKMSAAHRKV